MAQLNYPYATDFVKKLPAYPVTAACEFTIDPSSSDQDLANALHNIVNAYFNNSGSVTCYKI
jgi:hypothetical protein